MRSASYGAGGYTETGIQFELKDVSGLTRSYEDLEHALTLIRESTDEEEFLGWLLLHGPYIGDPGDPSIVAEWREKRPGLAKRHDWIVGRLAHYLRYRDLYVVFPKRMSSREEKLVDKRNDELYRLYSTFRGEGAKKTKAVQTAAAMCGYDERRAWDIVRLREAG